MTLNSNLQILCVNMAEFLAIETFEVSPVQTTGRYACCHQEQAKKKDDAENLPPVSRIKNKTKSKDAAVNEEPAANNDETPEMSDRLKTSVLDFRKQEGGEALRDREDDQQSRLSQPRARAISSHKDRTSASPKVSKGRKKR